MQVRARGQDLRRTLDELIFTLQHHPDRVQWCAGPPAMRWPGSGTVHSKGLLDALSERACLSTAGVSSTVCCILCLCHDFVQA